MSYFARLAAIITCAGALATAAWMEHMQANAIYKDSRQQDLLQSIALSAYMDLVLVSACVSFLITKRVVALVRVGGRCDIAPNASRRPAASKAASARVVCLASEKHCETLEFKDMCRIARWSGDVATRQTDAPEQQQQHVYITPAMLWLYVYAVSTGVFVLGYTMHGGHKQSCAVLLLSLTVCAIVRPTLEAYNCGDTRACCLRLVAGLFICIPVGIVLSDMLLAEGATSICATELGRRTPRCLLQGGWLGVILPALTPFAIGSCKERARALQLHSHEVVVFALPFLTAIAVCYISVYTPMRMAWMDEDLEKLMQWWEAGNVTIGALEPAVKSGVNESLRGAPSYYTTAALLFPSGEAVILWLLGPLAIGGSYVVLVTAMVNTAKTLGYTAALVLVVSARQAIEAPGPKTHAAVSMATVALLVASAVGPLHSSARLPLLAHIDNLFEDAPAVSSADTPSSFAIGAADLEGDDETKPMVVVDA